MPASAILVLGLFSPAISWDYVMVLGALPIALIWVVLRLLWPTLARRD
jgi:hypothetical protein